MSVSYNKLWKLLIDKSMTKTQLIRKVKISTKGTYRVKVQRLCFILTCVAHGYYEAYQDKFNFFSF